MKIKLNMNPFKLNLITSQIRSTETTCASQFKFKIVVYNYYFWTIIRGILVSLRKLLKIKEVEYFQI